jgi:Holliday junction resolvase
MIYIGGFILTNYEKGRRFEYRVRDLFRNYGFVVIRAAQSKPIDLVCLKNGNSILIECKTKKSSLTKLQKEELLSLAKIASTTPILAYRDKREVRLLNLQTNSFFSLTCEA